jgi:hypothetical protein
MAELSALGVTVTLPTGWEGRIFRRPEFGDVSATADDPAAPPGAATHSVVHVATISLPPGVGDFASGAVESLGPDDALVVLFEYEPASVDQPLFARRGIPRQLDPDDFSPSVLQRTIPGQAGAQVFFSEAERAYCLYVVLGSYARRRQVVPHVNEVLVTFEIEPAPR